jgi:hypothetical protein
MANELMLRIDDIEDAQFTAECDVLTALAETYMKTACILESADESTDLSAFNFLQEGVLNQPVTGWSSESTLKRILLFIPRLIVKLLKIALTIVGAVLAILLLPITAAGAAIYTAKVNKDLEIDVELDFDPEGIANGLETMSNMVEAVADMMDYEVDHDLHKNHPLSKAIEIYWPRIKPALDKMIEFNNNFNANVYKKTKTTKADANLHITRAKALQRVLQMRINKFQKLANKEADDENISAESKQHMSLMMKTLTESLKNYSSLSEKLKETKKNLKKEKGDHGAAVKNTDNDTN